MSATAEPPTFTCDVQPERALPDSGFRSLVVDLRGLTFPESSGLHHPLTLASSARDDGFRGELTGTRAALPFVEGR